MKSNFKLVLVDLEPKLCLQFEIAFKGVENVEVVNGPFEKVDFDCIVSAANSFGLMDGGVDGAITGYFGQQVMDRVQHRIITDYCGEQPVGTSFIIRGNETWGENDNKYVAHTPTMRIPKNIVRTDNVYQAMKSMLIAVDDFNINEAGILHSSFKNPINTVACTGLGTFCGEIPYKRAAKEMRLAYDNVMNPPTVLDWDFAVKRNNEIFKAKL